MLRFMMLALLIAHAPVLLGGQFSITTDHASGVQVYTIRDGSLTVKFAPSAGGNVFSIENDGIEYLRQPPSLDKLPGVGFGVPVLYPTPNRVKGARFRFGERTVEFKPNAQGNFIHGLVNRAAFDVVGTSNGQAGASIRCKVSFAQGTRLAEKFPFPHQLFMTITVKAPVVKWEYEVDNTRGKGSVPFGFALHPYFNYQGDRANTFLTIPATHMMESVDRLPTGELLDAEELSHPLGEAMSLKDTNFDDVFWGMRPEESTRIDFRDANRKVDIRASKEFTHLVVWTPDRPYFGIESQTCSTDAHNLHAAGKVKEAHLQICEPGKVMSGWVEYDFSP